MKKDNQPRIQDLYNEGYCERNLVSLTIELLNSCNWNCRHCYLPQHTNMGLEFDIVANILEQARDLNILEVVLTGGEIFLRKDIFDIIEKARSLYLRVYLYSNASLLTENKIRRLADYYITQYSLTLFSLDEKIHDSITRCEGSLKILLRNISLIQKYGIPIEIKTPVMNVNKDSLESISKFCEKNGFTFGTTPTINAQSNGNKEPLNLRLNSEELNYVLQEMQKIESNSRSGIGGKEPYKVGRFDEQQYCCPLLRSKLFIDCEGNVFPCTSFFYKVGNIKNDTLNNIWNHSPELRYVQSLSNSGLKKCQACDLKDFCTRCPGLALLEDGDVMGCSSLAKEMAQVRKSLYDAGTNMIAIN